MLINLMCERVCLSNRAKYELKQRALNNNKNMSEM